MYLSVTDDLFHPFAPDEWVIHRAIQMGTYLIQHLPSPLGPNPVPSGHISSSRPDTIYIKTQVFRLLRYNSPAPRNIARSDWATQNITHNMTSSIT